MMKFNEFRAPRRGVAVGAERHHELDVANRRHEARRQHADDDVLVAIEPDQSTDDAGIAAEASHPETLGEHDDMVRARAFVARLQQRGRVEDVRQGRRRSCRWRAGPEGARPTPRR